MPNPLGDIASIATIIEAIAVVASVLFIAYQVRQSTNLARVANTQSLVELSSPFNLQLIQDRKMAEFWVKGTNDYENMDTVDQYRYKSMLIWWLILHENIYFQWRQQLLDRQVYLGWERDLRDFVRQQDLAKFWPELGMNYHAEFADHVSLLIGESNKQVGPKSQKAVEQAS